MRRFGIVTSGETAHAQSYTLIRQWLNGEEEQERGFQTCQQLDGIHGQKLNSACDVYF